MDGILNINKPTGITSHDVVAKVRKLLGQRRVGHAGTLDPAASGVLPVCVGQSTRVAEYLSESGKAYRAAITFGIVTDTYDVEGTVIRATDTQNLALARIEAIVPAFLGTQWQTPPRYSAIKVQGQPAYKRTRAGEDVTLPARQITIERLDILDWQAPTLTLLVECSKGTYIRSLAYDLGERSGYGAFLQALVRTRSGPFRLEDSITLEQLAEAVPAGTIQHYLHPADKALEQYPTLVVDATLVMRIQHGNAFSAQRQPEPVSASAQGTQSTQGLARVYDEHGHFLAIAEWNEVQQEWRPKKVFDERARSQGDREGRPYNDDEEPSSLSL